jgi:hypothetical protein
MRDALAVEMIIFRPLPGNVAGKRSSGPQSWSASATTGLRYAMAIEQADAGLYQKIARQA